MKGVFFYTHKILRAKPAHSLARNYKSITFAPTKGQKQANEARKADRVKQMYTKREKAPQNEEKRLVINEHLTINRKWERKSHPK